MSKEEIVKMPALCRVCLAGDLKMYDIGNIQLVQMYEILANAKLVAGDGRPSTLCYVCYGQLRRCARFSLAARRADSCLAQLLRRGHQVTHETVTALDPRIRAPLTASTPRTLSVDDRFGASLAENERDFRNVYAYVCERESAPAVKEEPTEEILVEVENIHFESDESAAIDPSDARSDATDDPHRDAAGAPPERSGDASGRFPCGRCGKEFALKRYLKSHMLVHSGERRFACAQLACDKTFARKSDLNRHARSHSEAAQRRRRDVASHGCAQCGRSFLTRTALVSHARSHSAARPLLCVRCGAAFRLASNLAAHLRAHAGERPHACARCGRAFTARGNLAQHMRTHAPPAPAPPAPASAPARTHACPQCARTFPRAAYLTRHLRSHSGERPYACPACDKRYADSGSLHVHARTHTGERPYACAVCGRAFARSHQLKQHERSARCRS